MFAYASRAAILFGAGAMFALVFQLHQRVRTVPATLSSLSGTWWVPVACGTAAALIGLLFPCVDRKLGEALVLEKEWARVMRCAAIFAGINHFCARFDFPSDLQLTVTLAVASATLWWAFDRTRSGLGLALGTALAATLVTQVLAPNDCTERTVPLESWLPYVFFSGGITIGSIGRQLALVGP